jgi:hypothetical protein
MHRMTSTSCSAAARPSVVVTTGRWASTASPSSTRGSAASALRVVHRSPASSSRVTTSALVTMFASRDGTIAYPLSIYCGLSPMRATTKILVGCVIGHVVIGSGACTRDRVDPPRAAPRGVSFPTTIHASPKLTSIPVRRPDGHVERVACASCHSMKTPKALPSQPTALREFHQGLTFQHGELTCAHCHVARERSHDTLHLANGDLIPMVDALRLCAQCHGPQYRDYSHGSHGGMEGAFSPEFGPRTRNHCVDCHDPHTPRFQGGLPVLPPKDRGTLMSLRGDHD